MAKGRPKQKTLPTMEDRAIQPLQDAAHEYASVRDERMDLNQREHKLKEKVLGLMRKHGKQRYRFQEIDIEVVSEEETVKVRIGKPNGKAE